MKKSQISIVLKENESLHSILVGSYDSVANLLVMVGLSPTKHVTKMGSDAIHAENDLIRVVVEPVA